MFTPIASHRYRILALVFSACLTLTAGEIPALRTVIETSFEAGQPSLKATQHTVVADRGHTGTGSLFGEIAEANKARILQIPFVGKTGDELQLTFWAMGDRGSTCAIWLHQGNKRRPVGRETLRKKWTRLTFKYQLEADGPHQLDIVAPSSFGDAPSGKAWIDDLAVRLQPGLKLTWPEHPQSFPALACDGGGTVWSVMLERDALKACVRLSRVTDGALLPATTFAPEDPTGLAPPAIAPLAKGCVVAFPVEQKDRWRIAYAFVTGDRPELRYIDSQGNANISPALAVSGKDVHVLWESNAGEARGIYACTLTPEGPDTPQRLSAPDANSYNPAIVALSDGRLFAAWDSVRKQNADLYGAWFRDGKWQAEQRLTSHARVERHPALAIWKDRVWMAWQAQSYRKLTLNNLLEQRIVVAQIDDNVLLSPKGLFDKVSLKGRLLVRPRIAFDKDGRLWLTVRRSIHQNAGWAPEAWCYSGDKWSAPAKLHTTQGRWQPATLVLTPEGLLAAVQYDDLPIRWEEQGIHPDWKSGVMAVSLPSRLAGAATELQTEPLEMPPTDFSLTEKMDLCAALLPRQETEHHGRKLKLFWGDLHDHTDLSVCIRSINPPGHDLFANVRDIERLDFIALTDHGYNFDPPQWAYNGEQTRNNHDPGRFVTFLGQEWTSSKNPPAKGGTFNRYGHRNLVFLDPYHPTFHDSYDGDVNPRQLWDAIGEVEFITIPHQLADWKHKGRGNPPTDWSFHDEKLQPLAEIFQARQSYEYLGCPRQSRDGAPFKGHYLQDAWAKGIVIGTIASPDHGGGNGKAGVWAEELTRESIFRALQARHTFGTSGAKMALCLRSGDAFMGEVVKRPDGAIPFHFRALAMRPIKELVIFRNNEIVHRIEPGKTTVEVDWKDAQPPDVERLWYYVRIQAEDEELGWTSPIWFEKR